MPPTDPTATDAEIEAAMAARSSALHHDEYVAAARVIETIRNLPEDSTP